MAKQGVEAIGLVAARLGDMVDRVVFLGGAAVGLIARDPGGGPPRSTYDVDVVVEVRSFVEYQRVLRGQLIDRGFREDTDEGAPMCRWVVDGVKVDVMPINGDVLGFSNRWYPDAFANAVRCRLPDGGEIRVVTAPYFIATKLAALESRAGGDFQMSRDLEDIVAVLDGRGTTPQEIDAAPNDVRGYIAEMFARYLGDSSFLESLEGHMGPSQESQDRLPRLLGVMQKLSII